MKFTDRTTRQDFVFAPTSNPKPKPSKKSVGNVYRTIQIIALITAAIIIRSYI